MLTKIQQDLKYAIKTSFREPVISMAIFVTMALGVGATTAIFSAVYTLLIRPLPYPKAERLVSVGISKPQANSEQSLVMPPLLPELQGQSRLIHQLGGFSPNWTFTMTNLGDAAGIDGSYVTPGLLDMLGIRIVAGRGFLPEEQRTGGERVALVTRGFWNRKFGRNAVVGEKLITLDSQNYQIVGIVEDGRPLPKVNVDIYLPFSTNEYVTSRFAPVMNIVGTLADDATVAQAQSEMEAITRSVQKDYPSLRDKRLSVVSLREQMVGDLRGTLLMLFAAVGFLLIIACVNVANLLLSRATGREREIAMRAALGASRRRLIQQMLTESVFLAFIGGSMGLALAYFIIFKLVPMVPFDFVLSQDISLDGSVLAFSFFISIATGLMFGLVPALHAATPNLIARLKAGVKDSPGSSGRSLRSSLVVAEIAIAIVVLVGAGLLIRSFWMLSHVNPGFRTTSILTMSVFVPDTRYKEAASRVEFYRQLTEKLRVLPGVKSVGAVNRLPLNGSNILVGATVPGSAVTAKSPEMIDRRVADPNYFRTLSIPVIKGRYFTAEDGPDSPRVAIINQTMAARFWPNEDPLGRQAVLAIRQGMPVMIVGVVGDILHHGLDTQVQPELYVPYAQAATEGMVLVIRTAQPPGDLITAVRSQVWALDRQIPLDKMPSMDEVVSTSIARPWFRTMLLSGFAALALMLSAIGIYGVVSYSISRRSSEIGIRMALGAQQSNILTLILGEGAKLALIGVLVGLTSSFFVARFLRNLLYGIKPTDPFTLIAVTALMVLIALIACYIPTRRALRVNPIAALRMD